MQFAVSRLHRSLPYNCSFSFAIGSGIVRLVLGFGGPVKRGTALHEAVSDLLLAALPWIAMGRMAHFLGEKRRYIGRYEESGDAGYIKLTFCSNATTVHVCKSIGYSFPSTVVL